MKRLDGIYIRPAVYEQKLIRGEEIVTITFKRSKGKIKLPWYIDAIQGRRI